MVKLVDTLVSGTSGRKAVQVGLNRAIHTFFVPWAPVSDPIPGPFPGRGESREAPDGFVATD